MIASWENWNEDVGGMLDHVADLEPRRRVGITIEPGPAPNGATGWFVVATRVAVENNKWVCHVAWHRVDTTDQLDQLSWRQKWVAEAQRRGLLIDTRLAAAHAWPVDPDRVKPAEANAVGANT